MTGKISLQSEQIDAHVLKITATASDFRDGVFGVAFNLHYNDDALLYLRYEDGQFLECCGSPFYMVGKDRRDSSKIVFGSVLQANDSSAFGKGEVAHFYFQILDTGVVDFSVDKVAVSTLKNGARKDYGDLTGETLTVDLRGEEINEQVLHNKTSPFSANVMGDFLAGNHTALMIIFALMLAVLVLLRLRRI